MNSIKYGCFYLFSASVSAAAGIENMFERIQRF